MKPIVTFTSFWDANILVQDQSQNYQVYSIALGIPDSTKIPFIKNILKLNHFCPTYDLLMSYKKDGDWDKYKVIYRKILISRKDDIDKWLKGLEQDKTYILCCWEDTSKKCNCHRKILYDALKATKIWKDYAIWVYRNGNESSKQ